MKRKRPSLRDIASNLKVSVTTVSFVLNGKAREMGISEGVTQKILDYAEKINYTPNQLAQSLRTGKTNIIVFMVEDISNSFFARLARIIEIIAYKKGYKVIFCSNENSDSRTKELLNIFKDRKVDGYIIIPSVGAKPQIQALLEEHIPVVLFDRYIPGLETNYVVIDNENATYKASRHLIENGYQKIGLITIKTKQTQMIDRLKGYKRAMKEAKLELKVLEIPPMQDLSAAEKIMKNFFEENSSLDSVFFTTNYLAQHGLLVIRESFPKYLKTWGIMAFDDNEFFRIYVPSISAVAQPLQAIGENLMTIILQLMKESDKEVPLQQVVLASELKKRDSSKPKIVVSNK